MASAYSRIATVVRRPAARWLGDQVPADESGDAPAADDILDVTKLPRRQRHQRARRGVAELAAGRCEPHPGGAQRIGSACRLARADDAQKIAAEFLKNGTRWAQRGVQFETAGARENPVCRPAVGRVDEAVEIVLIE